MNDIKRISKIKREDLDERNYLKSILEEAYDKQIISDEDMIDLKMQTMELLDERVYRYTGYDNSSIRKETMEKISESISYTISVYLKSFDVPDDAISKIKEKGLKYACEEGRKRIDRLLNIIKLMYVRVKQNKLNVLNDTYNDTILGGIQGFLKIYDPEFEAQDMKITADYPLYNNLIGKLDGVEFIKEYINSIYLENTFCKKFSEEKINYLLYAYLHDYKEAIINIFEIVFLEVIACKLVKRNLQDLTISIAELDEIYSMFDGKKEIEIKNTILEIYKEIKEEILKDDKELQRYIEKNLNSILEIIINGLKFKTLDKVFITQKIIL